MTKIAEYLNKVDFLDERFVGTVAFREESLTLPDGSKMALGMDDGHWVLVFQPKAGSAFKVFEYDHHEQKIILDKKAGGIEDLKLFKKLVRYFMAQASVEDLVTILPPQPNNCWEG